MHNIVMIGPQGSGKGTQSERLAARVGIPNFAVGQLFRGEMAKGTDFGRRVAEYVTKGEIVPIELTVQAISRRMMQDDALAGVILDGFPRTLEQARQLDRIFSASGKKLTDAIFLDITDEVALDRLSGRLECRTPECGANYHVVLNPPKKDKGLCDRCGGQIGRRPDDEPEAIRRRLGIYHKETKPLVDFYRARGILRAVRGDRPIEQVEADIASAIGLL